MSKLSNRATNPNQYDTDVTDWESEGLGLESPTKAHFWEYVSSIYTDW